jgi:hypothetical protein
MVFGFLMVFGFISCLYAVPAAMYHAKEIAIIISIVDAELNA